MGDTVYFARDLASGNFKIGHTYNLRSRMILLRQAFPKVALIATIAGGRQIEGRFHARFIESHVGGEWFTPDQDVLAVVGRVAFGLFDIGELPVGTSPLRSASAHKAWASRRANGTPNRPWLARTDAAA